MGNGGVGKGSADWMTVFGMVGPELLRRTLRAEFVAET